MRIIVPCELSSTAPLSMRMPAVDVIFIALCNTVPLTCLLDGDAVHAKCARNSRLEGYKMFHGAGRTCVLWQFNWARNRWRCSLRPRGTAKTSRGKHIAVQVPTLCSRPYESRIVSWCTGSMWHDILSRAIFRSLLNNEVYHNWLTEWVNMSFQCFLQKTVFVWYWSYMLDDYKLQTILYHSYTYLKSIV